LSLIEMIAVLAVLSVLASLAGPGMSAMLAAQRVEGAARRLADDMALARREAVKRNAAVLVCPRATVADGSCAAPSAAGGWVEGWRLCYDNDRDDICDLGSVSDPNPMRVQDALGDKLGLSGPVSRLRFNADGTITATVYSRFTATSATTSIPAWQVRFAASGAMSVGKEGM
jgi:type IV fimbrial biogenesis protein FimT